MRKVLLVALLTLAIATPVHAAQVAETKVDSIYYSTEDKAYYARTVDEDTNGAHWDLVLIDVQKEVPALEAGFKALVGKTVYVWYESEDEVTDVVFE